MKKNNNRITSEVTPHHLFFNDRELKSFNTNLNSKGKSGHSEDWAMYQSGKETEPKSVYPTMVGGLAGQPTTLISDKS